LHAKKSSGDFIEIPIFLKDLILLYERKNIWQLIGVFKLTEKNLFCTFLKEKSQLPKL